jgi:hypothetical protein
MPLLWEGISVSRSSSWLSWVCRVPYARVSLPGFPCTICSWLLIAYCLLPNTYCLLPIVCRCRCYVSRQDQVRFPFCRVVNFESSSPIIARAYSAPVPAYCLHVRLLLHGFANTSPMLLHWLPMPSLSASLSLILCLPYLAMPRCRLLLLVDIPSVTVPVTVIVVCPLGIPRCSIHCVPPHIPVVRCPGSQLRLSLLSLVCWFVGLLDYWFVLRSHVPIVLLYDDTLFSLESRM